MTTSRWWKAFYGDERQRLGETGLGHVLDQAAPVVLPPQGCVVVPHVTLEACGAMLAGVARAVVASGCERIVALGVLHGPCERYLDEFRQERAAGRQASSRFRGLHRGEDALTSEEFSLDSLCALVALEATRRGRRQPRIDCFFPCWVGEQPASCPGFDALATLVADGAVVVATGDHLHHGHGYGTPSADVLDAAAAGTRGLVRERIASMFSALAKGDVTTFRSLCLRERSDFADVGVTLRHLLGSGAGWTVHQDDLVLADYSRILSTPPPTWVAAALVRVEIASALG